MLCFSNDVSEAGLGTYDNGLAHCVFIYAAIGGTTFARYFFKAVTNQPFKKVKPLAMLIRLDER